MTNMQHKQEPSLSTPESVAAYEAEYGPIAPGGHDPALEREPTPYDLWLTDDPEATWDDPNLAGPAERQAEDPKRTLTDPEPEAEI